jgi:hypothetical protein
VARIKVAKEQVMMLRTNVAEAERSGIRRETIFARA